MDENIEKICKNCGPLTRDKIIIRLRKGKPYKICRPCENKQQRESFKKHRAKYLERDRLARTYERAGDTKEMRCSKCKEIKPIEKFNAHMIKIKYPYCRDCRIAVTKDHHAKEESKQKHREWYNTKYVPVERNLRYIKTYGITLDQYNEMSVQQDHKCKICKKPETAKSSLRKDGSYNLAVDHCHKTGKVRGLLCQKCNGGLGQFHDSIQNLYSAIEYLKLC